jgi:hypothetical protein
VKGFVRTSGNGSNWSTALELRRRAALEWGQCECRKQEAVPGRSGGAGTHALNVRGYKCGFKKKKNCSGFK